MTYVSQINAIFGEKLAVENNLVVYGQNVAAGSCLSGLTRGFLETPGSTVLNTPNSENALVGAGFGLMLKGFNAAYFMKQQDFLLLGCDQLVNSWNILRRRGLSTSFTIVTIIVDSGFEGPQSRLNNFADFCSMAHVRGIALSNEWEARQIIDAEFVSSGFRIIGVSQRMFGRELPEIPTPPNKLANGDIYCYGCGDDLTIVSVNFAFERALEFWTRCAELNLSASLYSVPVVVPQAWDEIISDVAHTGRLVIVDDSKSWNRPTDRLLYEIALTNPNAKCVSTARAFTEDALRPNEDDMVIDEAQILNEVGLKSAYAAAK